MSSGDSYYDLLEVSPTATAAEVKAAYRGLAREYHPDGLPAHRPRLVSEAAEKLKRIVVAYETLADPGRRRSYDDRLRRAARERASGGAAGRGGEARPPASGSAGAPPPRAGQATPGAAAADAWVGAIIAHERGTAHGGVGGAVGGVVAVALVTIGIAAAVVWLGRHGGVDAEQKVRIARRAQSILTSLTPAPTPTPAPAVIVYRDGTEQPVLAWRRAGDVTHLTDLEGRAFVVRSIRIDYTRSRSASAPPP